MSETDLNTLLANMSPQLDPRPFVFCTVSPEMLEQLGVVALCLFREAEGVTLILDQGQADGAGLGYTGLWALITLTVYSDLTAVGFLAEIAGRLAAEGLSVNAVSAYYHDHLFIPWEHRDRAMSVLQTYHSIGLSR